MFFCRSSLEQNCVRYIAVTNVQWVEKGLCVVFHHFYERSLRVLLFVVLGWVCTVGEEMEAIRGRNLLRSQVGCFIRNLR